MFKYRNFLEADSADPTVAGLTTPHNRVGVPRPFAVQTTWRQVGRWNVWFIWPGRFTEGTQLSKTCWASNFPNCLPPFLKRGEKKGGQTRRSCKKHTFIGKMLVPLGWYPTCWWLIRGWLLLGVPSQGYQHFAYDTCKFMTESFLLDIKEELRPEKNSLKRRVFLTFFRRRLVVGKLNVCVCVCVFFLRREMVVLG